MDETRYCMKDPSILYLQTLPAEVQMAYRTREEAVRKFVNIKILKERVIDFWKSKFPGNIIIVVAIILALSWIFQYKTTVDVKTTETYDHFTGYVDTYLCYITDYGSCYHSKYCEYLWNSSIETTVYHAEKDGYVPCSKCRPTQKVKARAYEERTREVITQKTVKKKPFLLVTAILLGPNLILCVVACLIEPYRKRKLKRIHNAWLIVAATYQVDRVLLEDRELNL